MGNIVLRKNRVTANTLIGKVGDLTYNSVDKTLFIHDGTSTGGFSLFRYSTTSAIVSGQIPFSNGTQGVLSTSTLLKWDNVNNYLGVGTSTPGFALDVVGDIRTNPSSGNAALRYARSGTNKWAIYNDSSDNFIFYSDASSSERMRIGSSGNVGIGTGSTIRSILNTHVGTITGPAVTAGLTLSAFYSGVTAVNTIDWNYSGQTSSPVRLGATFNSDGSGMEMVFYTSTSFTTNGAERVRIDKDGKVGIGTTSPGEKLHVNGNIRLSGATSGYITLTPTAIAGTTTITLPATTGTVVTTGDTGTVTNTMLANSTISGISLGSNLATLTIGTGLSGTSYNGSTAVTITNNDKGSSQNIFKTINVEALAGSSIGTLTAANNTDSFKLKEGNNITLSVAGNTITITANVSGGGSSGVTTLNGLAGALSITSTGGNLTVSPSGSTIDLSINSTPASTLTGTIPSGVLGNSNVFIGTTSVALNRASANLALTGISSVQFPGSTSGTVTLQAAAIAGTTTITLPATTGTVVTTGDTGTVTSTMILDGTIVNGDISATAAIVYSKLSLGNSIVNADIATSAGIVYSKLSLGNSIVNADIATGAAIAVSKLAASTISGITLGNNLATLTFGSFLTGTSYNGSTAATIAVDATSTNTVSKVVARDASGNFSAGTITATLFSGSGASLTSIPNSALVNSSTTVNGTAISLGSSGTITANTTNSLTFNNAGSGAASGTTFNGSAAQTISYNTIGAPSITGTNASGTWGISVTGNAATASAVAWSGITSKPTTISGFGITNAVTQQDGTRSNLDYNAQLTSGFYNVDISPTNGPSGINYNQLIVAKGIDTGLQISGGFIHEMYYRGWQNSGATFTAWKKLLDSSNYNSYSPTLTGTGASGTWGINITGTATTLQTSRNFSITGPVTASSVSFNGSGDVQLASIINTTTLAVNLTTERVGIGTTTPSTKLHVIGDTTLTGNLSVSGTLSATISGYVDTSTTQTINGSKTFTSTVAANITGTSFNITQYTINQSVGTGNSPSFAGLTVDTNTLYVDATNDRVGIGTTSPAQKLEVSSSASGGTNWIRSTNTAASGSAGFLGVLSGVAGVPYSAFELTSSGGGQLNIISSAAYPMVFNISGAEKMRLTALGNLGINGTTDSYRLYVGGDIYATGDVYAGSDIRMKENITELTNALDKIKNLQGYSYNKIGVNHRSIGLMAQDVEKIIPEVVSRNTEGMKGIDYGQMIAMLVEAIKELSTKMETINGTTI